jgi:hypothetical protein
MKKVSFLSLMKRLTGWDHKWNKKIVNWDEVHSLLRYSFCVPLDANSMFVALRRCSFLKYTVLCAYKYISLQKDSSCEQVHSSDEL